MKNNELSDLKKIIYDKIALFITLLLVGFVSLYFIESKKKDIAYEQALALKYSEYQIETYKLANEVAYRFYILLDIFLKIQKGDNNFQDKMYQVEQESNKLNKSIGDLQLLIIKNSPFLSPYSVKSVYLPLLQDLYNFNEEMTKAKNNFMKAQNIAKQFFKKINKHRDRLLSTNEIFVKIKSKNINAIKSYSNLDNKHYLTFVYQY
jgi:hypothetical protein